MSQALTSFQFTWEGKRYRVSMPDTNGIICLPDRETLLIVEHCEVRKPTPEEDANIIRGLFPIAQLLK